MKNKNKQILLLCLLFLSVAIHAQNVRPQYAKGAVPEIDGKVIFSREIKVVDPISTENLFSLMNDWAKHRYDGSNNNKNRVILSDAAKGNIVCIDEKEIIFKSTALSLDRAFMSYQLILEIDNQKCLASVRNIRYAYSEAGKVNVFPAEETITDKIALNKQGTKLNRYYDKFRVHSIDSINRIFDNIDVFLNGIKNEGAVQNVYRNQANTPSAKSEIAPPSIPVVVSVSENTAPLDPKNVLSGYRRIEADKIPGNIIKLLNDWTLITSGNNKINMMTATWGGLGVLWEQPVAFSFINPTRYSINTMDEGDTYTISFYTETYKDALNYCGTHSGRNEDKVKGSGLTLIKTPSGSAAFSEAWMIIECKKILAQPISEDGVIDKNISEKWHKDSYHKMYIGQILNVWVK